MDRSAKKNLSMSTLAISLHRRSRNTTLCGVLRFWSTSSSRRQGKRALEVGSGLGFFGPRSTRARCQRVATDIGEELLRRVKATVGCECVRVDALALVDHFGPDAFDVVLSSECIEHTPTPRMPFARWRGY